MGNGKNQARVPSVKPTERVPERLGCACPRGVPENRFPWMDNCFRKSPAVPDGGYEALSACSSDWDGRLFTPEIKLGSSSSPLSVKRGDGALISATYTGAVSIEYSADKETDGLTVAAGVTAEMRNFTLTNSVRRRTVFLT